MDMFSELCSARRRLLHVNELVAELKNFVVRSTVGHIATLVALHNNALSMIQCRGRLVLK